MFDCVTVMFSFRAVCSSLFYILLSHYDHVQQQKWFIIPDRFSHIVAHRRTPSWWGGGLDIGPVTKFNKNTSATKTSTRAQQEK